MLTGLLTALVAATSGPVLLVHHATPVAEKAGPTRIEFAVEPGTVIIYLDGQKKGRASKVHVVTVKPGRHDVRLVNGKDEEEFEVSVEKGKTLKVEYKFEDSGSPAPNTPPSSPKPAPEEPSPDEDESD